MSRAEDHACFYGCLTCLERKMRPVRAYRIPYSTYKLWLCLRCAKPYPDGPAKEPVTVIPWLTSCDRCHVKIPMTEPKR